MKLKTLFGKYQKQIQLIFTIACLVGAGVVLCVGHSLFHDRISLFWIFTSYIVILTLVAIFFGRRLIAMICDA